MNAIIIHLGLVFLAQAAPLSVGELRQCRPLEAEWRCALAARGIEVFGQNPGDPCPGKDGAPRRRPTGAASTGRTRGRGRCALAGTAASRRSLSA